MQVTNRNRFNFDRFFPISLSNNDCRYLDNCFSENAAPNFGQIADKTCDNGFQRFDRVYKCVENGIGWQSGVACSNEDFRSQYGGCCEFTPKVQAKDNWGWCNGTCGAAGSPGGIGCYDAGWQVGDVDECKNPAGTYTPFASFAGSVIIAP